MKIITIANLPIPIDTKSGGRIHFILQHLANSGNQVEVWSIAFRNLQLNKFDNQIDGIHYRFILKWKVTAKDNVFLKFFFRFFSISKILYNLCFKTDKTSIIVLFPAFDFRLIVLFIAWIKKVKVILEINEYPCIQMRQNSWTKFKQMVLLKISLKFYSGIIVISDELYNLVLKYKKQNALVVKIPIIAHSQQNTTLQLKSISHPFILHAGSLTEKKDGILGMLESFGRAKQILKNDLKFFLTGSLKNASEIKKIENIINDYNIKNEIVFLDYLSSTELDFYLKNADLAIINKYDNEQNRFCFSTKLAEYLSYAIPVVTTDVGEAMNYLKCGENAIIVANGNIEDMTDAIVKYYSNISEFRQIGLNGQKLFHEKFKFDCHKNQINSFFSAV